MSKWFSLVSCILLAASFTGARAAGKAECPIFPIPKVYRVKDSKPVTLRSPVAIVLGKRAAEPEKFAASRLSFVLKKRFGLDVSVATDGKVPRKTRARLILGTLENNKLLKTLRKKHSVGLDAFEGKDPMQDAFAIECLKRGRRPLVLMIGSSPRSVIYAQYAFLETLVREDGKVLYPNMSVRDWAGLRYRDWWPGSPSYFATIPYALDQVTYARPNMTQLRTFKSAEVSKDLVKECWRRGMKPYGTINGAVRRDAHPYAVQETKAWIEKGCYGIYVSFDDFGMGEDPEGLCGKVTDILKKHFGKVGDRIAVISGGDYDFLNSRGNRRMRKFRDIDEAIFYITGPPHGVFSTKRHYDDARAVGIKNYVWWHNFAMGSKGFYAPVRARRYFAQLPFNRNCWGRFTFDDLRQGDKHMTGYCAQNDGWDIAAIQLFWAWDPVHYDYEKARTVIYRRRHGAAAVEAARSLDNNMYKLTEYYRLMWRHYAMTAWPLADVSKRKEVLALLDKMQEQFQAIKDGKSVSYLSDEAYDEHFIKPLEAHLDAAKRLASLDFPEYAVQKREGFNTRGGANLLKAWAALSLRTKMIRLLSAGKTREAEAYLAGLRKEALPMLKIIETELKDMWYTKEYVDGWRSMLELKHWEPFAKERFNKRIGLTIRRNAKGLVVMEPNAANCEILFTLDGPPPAVGAAEVYNGPRSLPGSHVVRAMVTRKGKGGLQSRVFEHHLGYPKTDWEVVYTDSDDGRDAAGANAIDENLNTVWLSDRTKAKPPHPHEIRIDLGRQTVISAIAVYPRRNDGRGAPKRYEAYASDDGKSWGDPVAAGEFGRFANRFVILLKKRTKARFIRLVFLSGFRGLHFSAVAEVDALNFAPRAAVEPKGELRPGLRYTYCETAPMRRWREPKKEEVRKSGVVATPTLEIEGRREEHFAVVYEGYVRIAKEGLYVFSTASDDGSILWLGGNVVVDNDGLHAPRERDAIIPLAVGSHEIRIAFFEAGGGQTLRVYWQPAGGKKELLPAGALFHAED